MNSKAKIFLFYNVYVQLLQLTNNNNRENLHPNSFSAVIVIGIVVEEKDGELI